MNTNQFAIAQINEILNQQVGEIGYGRKVFIKKTGKKTTQYVDGNGNKVDGRKVIKYNNILNDEIETIKKVKPTRIITKETRNMSKIEKDYPKKNKNESVEEYEKDKARYLSKIQRSINKKAKTDDLKSSLGEEYYKGLKYVSVADNIIIQQNKKFIEDQKKITTPKPVIKKNEIIEKKTTPKQSQGKQTTDQLEKRRVKYQENRAKELARKRAYREANKEKINAKQDAYRETAKSVAYQKSYRDANAKPKEPKPIKPIINKIIKPRKVRTDAGQERGKYNVVNPEQMKKKYPRPDRKSGESEEVYNIRRGIWDKVIRGKLKPKMLGMKSAVKVAYGEGIISGGKEISVGDWIKKIEKGGRDIERDGLGMGNLGTAETDPDEVF